MTEFNVNYIMYIYTTMSERESIPHLMVSKIQNRYRQDTIGYCKSPLIKLNLCFVEVLVEVQSLSIDPYMRYSTHYC
jgi:hypothetical protein